MRWRPTVPMETRCECSAASASDRNGSLIVSAAQNSRAAPLGLAVRAGTDREIGSDAGVDLHARDRSRRRTRPGAGAGPFTAGASTESRSGIPTWTNGPATGWRTVVKQILSPAPARRRGTALGMHADGDRHVGSAEACARGISTVIAPTACAMVGTERRDRVQARRGRRAARASRRRPRSNRPGPRRGDARESGPRRSGPTSSPALAVHGKLRDVLGLEHRRRHHQRGLDDGDRRTACAAEQREHDAGSEVEPGASSRWP